jgi:CheY-specific phosphatase CheX
MPDLEILLEEMISTVLGGEIMPTRVPLPPGQLAISRLIIHDMVDDSYLAVELRVEGPLAQMLAASMLTEADPTPDEVLDAIAELGNIAGGNVKTLLCHHARLSLPSPTLAAMPADDLEGTVRVGVTVLGHTVELVVMALPAAEDSTRWPPEFAEQPTAGLLDEAS